MKTDDSRSIVVRTEEKVVLEAVVRRLREGGVTCQVQSMSVWQYGLPRTEFEVAVAQPDAEKARGLTADLPQAGPCSGVKPAQRAWIIFGLAVIAVVAILRLIML